MTNEIEKKNGVFGNKVSMIDTDALKEAMAVSSAADPRGAAADGSDYMSFSGKRNVYEVGKEKRDVQPDELFLVNVPVFEDGWICWKGGRVLAKRMVSLIERSRGVPLPVVDQTEHGPFDKGDGWQQAKSMTIRSLDSGQQCYFAINSISGVSVFASLQKEINQRLLSGLPYWPVVSFDKESFTSQGYKNFKPAITVDGWLSTEQVTEELPAIFADPDAEIDLDAMYAASIPVLPPTDGDGGGKTVARRRRSV